MSRTDTSGTTGEHRRPALVRPNPATTRLRKRLALVGVPILVFLISGCTAAPEKKEPIPPYGRGRVLSALDPRRVDVANPSQNNILPVPEGRKSLAGRFRPGGPSPGRPFRLKLRDGSRLGGLFFPHPEAETGSKPLLMAGFGFLQDRWGVAAVQFYERHLHQPGNRIDAHVLILDHTTSAPFLAANGALSIGSYDEARMWIEIGRYLRKTLPIRSIHLFGVGVSGQTVVHALIEDQRLGLQLFESGVAISLVPDLRRYPGRILALFEAPADRDNPWRTFRTRFRRPKSPDRRQKAAIESLIEKQFLPHFRQLHPRHTAFELADGKIPVFFRQAFENRLAALRTQRKGTTSWNPEFMLTDLDDFMRTTRVRPLIARVQTPLVLLHAADDPIVPESNLAAAARAARRNPWVIFQLTERGGHGDFGSVYGGDYLRGILETVLAPEVLRNWRAEITSGDY